MAPPDPRALPRCHFCACRTSHMELRELEAAGGPAFVCLDRKACARRSRLRYLAAQAPLFPGEAS